MVQSIPVRTRLSTNCGQASRGDVRSPGNFLKETHSIHVQDISDAIKENLKRVKMPPGFKISLYAIVPDARLLLAATVNTSTAGDIEAGKARLGMCATCHGPLGVSQLPNAPHLAGQPEIYTTEQPKQYRDGKRANAVMAVIAKSLSDKDIEDLAAWYGSIAFMVKEK